MNKRADLLIQTLSKDSLSDLSRVFDKRETERLVEISRLESIGDSINLEKKILEFKSNYCIDETDWLDYEQSKNEAWRLPQIECIVVPDPTPALLNRLFKLKKLLDEHHDLTMSIEEKLLKFECGGEDEVDNLPKALSCEPQGFIEELDMYLSRFERINSLNSGNLQLLNRII